MWELPLNKTNFLFENTKDFNQIKYGGPQDPIVFIHSISLNFKCLSSVKDVFKWSHHGHITLFSVTSQCMLIKHWKYFLQTNNFQFFFQENTLFQG